MPVLSPQFDAAQPAATQANLALQSENDTQNWMTQAAQRQQLSANTQETQARTAQMQAVLPAVIAKAHADQIGAQNAVATATAQQLARASAGPQATAANKEFLGIMGLDPDENPDTTSNIALSEDPVEMHEQRLNQLSALQAKYSGLELIPEYKPIYNQIEEAKKNEYEMVAKHLSAKTELEARRYQADAMTDRAVIAADARQKVAETTAGARTESAAITAGARKDAAQTTASAGMNREAFKQFSDTALSYEAAALKETDDAKAAQMLSTAKQFRDRAQRLQEGSPASGGAKVTAPDTAAPSAPAGEAPASPAVTQPAVVAPTHLPKGATTVTIAGKTYPVFKDAKGNHAYKMGDHYVPIESE